MIPTPYLWLIRLGLLLVAFAAGVFYEHGRFMLYKGKVEGAAQMQAQAAKTTDQRNEGNSDEADKRTAQAVASIDSWYRSHPVIRVQHDCPSPLSQAAGNPQGSDAATASLYASPYSPADTEQVAARLDQLQKLLTADGVTVK